MYAVERAFTRTTNDKERASLPLLTLMIPEDSVELLKGLKEAINNDEKYLQKSFTGFATFYREFVSGDNEFGVKYNTSDKISDIIANTRLKDFVEMLVYYVKVNKDQLFKDSNNKMLEDIASSINNYMRSNKVNRDVNEDKIYAILTAAILRKYIDENLDQLIREFAEESKYIISKVRNLRSFLNSINSSNSYVSDINKLPKINLSITVISTNLDKVLESLLSIEKFGELLNFQQSAYAYAGAYIHII